MTVETTWAPDTYRVDLNAVRDGNRAVALLGFDGPQRVPDVGDVVTAVDEDGNAYVATVESVLPDCRVYLRLKWESRRTSTRDLALQYGKPRWIAVREAVH